VSEGSTDLRAGDVFCNRDLEINPMALKLVDIPKMYLHTENEAASLRHSKLRACIGKKYENMSRG